MKPCAHPTFTLTFILILTLNLSAIRAQSRDFPVLTEKRAYELSQLALHCIHREYPNKTGHVMNDSSELWSPSQMHPAFYGCFDWHSSVHGHWMLVRLLKNFPKLRNSTEIRKALDQNLQKDNVLKELEYFQQAGRKSFERTYGWAWLLKLAEELYTWDDPDGRKWSANLYPLTDKIVSNYKDFLPKQEFPIRTGVHPNTAFGLAFALDYAAATHQHDFHQFLVDQAKTYYLEDQDAPVKWEPGGEDFFSPTLLEADLMTRVLDQKEYQKWLEEFFILANDFANAPIFSPALIADKTDGKIVHLDGLNLSRAWCMKNIANSLPEHHPLAKLLETSASQHAEHALNNIVSGSYEGEHWLASFAVYLLSIKGD